MTVRFLKGVKQELAKAEAWYAKVDEDLAADFYLKITLAVAEILNHPTRFPKDQTGVHRFLVDRFPYGILYKIEKNKIVVVAIMHTSRRPGYWRKR